MIRGIVIALLLSGVVEGWSQTGARRQAMRALGKEKWQKSRSILDKALHKDSTSCDIFYGFSLYYFTPSNPSFDIDSAYLHVNKALAVSRPGSLKRPRPDAPDSLVLTSLRRRIDSAAYHRARREHSEASYTFFVDHFPHAVQSDSARLLREAVAWHDALNENSPQAFAAYLEKYPSSMYAGKARARYEELVFRINTRDRRLSSFEAFLAEYPESPYRHLVEEQIMEIFTADGSPEKFAAFLRRYPQGAASRKARNILYHLSRETEPDAASFAFWTDSLRRIQELNARYLVPFTSEGKFGFMDASGQEIIAARSASLNERYRCGNIHDDILVSGNEILSRDGTVIFEGRAPEPVDLGYGFIGIETQGCYHVLHKGGFDVATGCIQEAAVLDGRFLTVLEESRWSVYSLTGRLLTSGWEEVRSEGNVVALRKGGKWTLATSAQLGLTANQQPLESGPALDDVRAWPDGLIWAKQADTEGVLNSQLRIAIPFGKHELRRESFGIVLRSEGCIQLYGPGLHASACMDGMKFNAGRVFAKQAGAWSLFDPAGGTGSGSYDSIAFAGAFPAGYRGDTVRVFFDDPVYIDFRGVDLGFIPGRTAGTFLLVQRGGLKTVYDHGGAKLFEGRFDGIQHAGGEYFIVSRGDKKGLVTSTGKQVLPLTYDGIGEIEGTRVPLLRGLRFGLYDVTANREIRPAYEKNIVPYNKELFVAFREGKAGMIDFDNRVRIPFRYDAFRSWNDTSAFARQDNVWKIVDIRSNEAIIDDIHDYSVVSDSEGETVVVIRRGAEFGVLSNTRGEVIPVSYTDLVNIGSSEDPLYFAEKHVREASLSVIIYYDRDGRPVRHQALDPDGFDAIYCEEN